VSGGGGPFFGGTGVYFWGILGFLGWLCVGGKVGVGGLGGWGGWGGLGGVVVGVKRLPLFGFVVRGGRIHAVRRGSLRIV